MSKKPSNAAKKISILVGIQIVIILASFLTLQFFESEKLYLGNAVNAAGKDRFLTANVIVKLQNYVSGQAATSDVLNSLQTYENNLLFVKNGGQEDQLKLEPLEPKFHTRWQSIHELFLEFEGKVQGYLATEQSSNAESMLVEINKLAENLVEQNDILTDELGLEVEILSSRLISLQIVFAIINIGVHVFMIWLIFRILKQEAERSARLDRLSAIGEIAARLAHDLRNPLTVIKNTIDLVILKSQNTNEPVKEHYKMIQLAAERMNLQLTDVMDFVKVREPQLKENSLKEIINIAASTTKIPDNINLILPQNNVILNCDQRQMEVLFSNMILNAAESIGQQVGTISIRIGEDQQNVLVEVEDSGAGIPEDVMPKLFEPMFTTKKHGTGLGLVSCKNIVNVHKGTITAQNNPTKFIITLPKAIGKKTTNPNS